MYDTVAWERRDVEVTGDGGRVVFRQEDVEAPKSWSQRAVNVTASKYFRGNQGTPERESSVRQLIDRVVKVISSWARADGYFEDDRSSAAFEADLAWLLLHQYVSFNSPVWFNVGTQEAPQCAACFILSVDDNMESLTQHQTTEAMIFKGGSGSGANLSKVRSSHEFLSSGGRPGGVLAFMRAYDAWAGQMKSGGTTRRAAKMVTLDVDHPDIVETLEGTPGFIPSKAAEEKKAWALIDAGYDGGFNVPGGAYESVSLQNANHSVRVTDAFMHALEKGRTWDTRSRTTGEVVSTYPARDMWRGIAEATHVCGDPGLQFDDTIQKWNPCSDTDRIEGSNPCCFVGDTLVDTSEGKISIADLAVSQDLPHAFAFDPDTRLPVLRRILRAWQSGETQDLVEVTTDKGIKVRCTPEHKFLLRDGSYVEAQDLRPGSRLRKIGRTINTHRSSRHCLNHRATEVTPRGTVWQSRFMWEQVYGPIPSGSHVHHINGDPTDDRLSNFSLERGSDHGSDHSRGSRNSRFISASVESLVEVWEAVESLPKKTHKNGILVTPQRWNRYIEDHQLAGHIPRANQKGIQGMSWAAFASMIEEHRPAVNDTVVAVDPIRLDRPVPVFDLEVQGPHNFSVTSPGVVHSVVVHNSEYMFLNDTACNLASLNLLKFQTEDDGFDVQAFHHAVDCVLTAQEVMISRASYPTQRIAKNSARYRPLGIGYTNLGALLMAKGLPYDSDQGRRWAAVLTSLLSGRAYYQSAQVAKVLGPFEAFEANRESVRRVILQHQAAAVELAEDQEDNELAELAELSVGNWDTCVQLGFEANGDPPAGFRNAQISVLAPTGTISFMMDCDTTGIEPDLALVKYKQLVGGGSMKLVNQTVPRALAALGYGRTESAAIVEHIQATGTIEGAPGIRREDLPVFDCALEPEQGERCISPRGHIRMMAAVQPFLSGAISKTVNLPRSATVQDIQDVYMEAWKLGLKAVAVYRDGSKRTQPVSTSASREEMLALGIDPSKLASRKRKLPDDRPYSRSKKVKVGNFTLFIHVNGWSKYDIGEIFCNASKQGSTIQGLIDTVCRVTSVSLQHGTPLDVLCEKLSYMQFEPMGFTSDPELPTAKSIVDYLFRFLQKNHLPPEAGSTEDVELPSVVGTQTDAPPCPTCGALMHRVGSCHQCATCGTNTGCGG